MSLDLDEMFPEVPARQAKLFADFDRSELVILEGVVASSGLGASTGGEVCHLTFKTLPWRLQGGELVHETAVVHRRCSKAEVDAMFEALSEYSVYRIEGKLLPSPKGWNGAQIELARLLDPKLKDPELERAVEELKKPVTHHDAQFGKFTLNRRVNWFEAETPWLGAVTQLHLQSDKEDAEFPHDSLEQARLLWKDANRWDREIQSMMLRKLLDLKNGNWLEEDEKELTAADFLSRVSLSSITVDPTGSFEFWYDDGDLFWGHSIMVSGSFEEGLQEAGIHG